MTDCLCIQTSVVFFILLVNSSILEIRLKSICFCSFYVFCLDSLCMVILFTHLAFEKSHIHSLYVHAVFEYCVVRQHHNQGT